MYPVLEKEKEKEERKEKEFSKDEIKKAKNLLEC